MWQRRDLKTRAKAVLKTCYWKAILVSIVFSIVAGGSSGSSGSSNPAAQRQVTKTVTENGGVMQFIAMLVAMIVVVIVVLVIVFGISIFLFQPLAVGCTRFFIISRVQQASLGEMGYCFKNSYVNVVKIQFLRGLYTFLWTLLLVVPGIIKGYEYRMIPYILAENPGMDSKEVFRLSKDMMHGEKWNAFVLDLSFILWNILSLFTCGILSVFYVNPYMICTNTELYDVLKGKVLGTSNGNQGGQEQDVYQAQPDNTSSY